MKVDTLFKRFEMITPTMKLTIIIREMLEVNQIKNNDKNKNNNNTDGRKEHITLRSNYIRNKYRTNNNNNKTTNDNNSNHYNINNINTQESSNHSEEIYKNESKTKKII